MELDPNPAEALPLLARLYRERRSGVLSVGPDDPPLLVLLREGQVVGLLPPGHVAPPARPPSPGPDDSVLFRLDRVLKEVGLRPGPRPAPPLPEAKAGHPRTRLIEALVSPLALAAFTEGAEGADGPSGVVEVATGTEPLILEAVRALGDAEAVRAALGDLDQRLVVTTALAEERTLTLTEGYLLSRIDGTSSAREVLQLVPLDSDETERTLLGLLLTGRVEYRAAPPRPSRRHREPVSRVDENAREAEPEPVPPPGEPPPAHEHEAFPEVSPVEEEPPPGPAAAAAPGLDLEARERKKEIWEFLNTLPSKNHFEVLGVEPGCSDGDVKRAYASLVRRFHPDAQGDPRLADMHDFLAAILIRAREALEVLGTARSRTQYEAKSGVVRRERVEPEPAPAAPVPSPSPSAAPPSSVSPPGRAASPVPRTSPPAAPAAAPSAPPMGEYVPPEEILLRARLLLSQARYFDVIQFLKVAVPQIEPLRQQHKARVLLAKAYAKNPMWVRLAEEHLHRVVREDSANVEAHFELGLLYKQVGQVARAQAAFRRVIELKPEHREAAAELGLDSGPGGPGLLKRLFGKGKAS